MVKFLKKGLKFNGEYFSAWYSSAKNNVNGNATVYLRDYKRLPQEAHSYFNVENESDSQTDYFETDRIRIAPNSPYFQIVEELARVEAEETQRRREAKNQRIRERRYVKLY